MIPFELAGGSVLGTAHRVIPKNNQDAWHVAYGKDALVAVVCDGCGSGAYSEVGARMGAHLIANTTLRHAQSGAWSFDRIQADVLALLRVIALQMGGSFTQTVNDYFLFTVVGVVLSGYTARFFAAGDGLIIANGNVQQLGPFSDNQPPYLSYALFGEDVRLDVCRYEALDELDHFLIGCDGAGRPGLLQVCEEDRKLPGTEKSVGSISRFWEDDDVFSNPDALRRRLKLIARDWPTRNPERGLLADDTTIVVGRRKREEL